MAPRARRLDPIPAPLTQTWSIGPDSHRDAWSQWTPTGRAVNACCMFVPTIATVCGSLRAKSSNEVMLAAFARVLGARAVVSSAGDLAALPHFNPDLDRDPLPATVVAWRAALATADAVVISAPEYAHGLPGAFKNGLDWLVSDPAFAGQRIALLHADRGSTWALDSLREILRTMDARLIEPACVGLRLGSNRVTVDNLLSRPELHAPLVSAAAALLDALAGRVSRP